MGQLQDKRRFSPWPIRPRVAALIEGLDQRREILDLPQAIDRLEAFLDQQ